jgi:hypothetical protein
MLRNWKSLCLSANKSEKKKKKKKKKKPITLTHGYGSERSARRKDNFLYNTTTKPRPEFCHIYGMDIGNLYVSVKCLIGNECYYIF